MYHGPRHSAVGRIQSLRELSIHRMGSTQAFVVFMENAQFINLRRLTYMGQIDDAAMEAVARFTKLTRLSVWTSGHGLTDTGIIQLAESCRI